MPEDKIRELTLPDGTKVHGIEVELEVVSEGWNEYALPNGSKLRVKNTAVKVFQIVDEKGNPVYNTTGEPEIVVNALATNIPGQLSSNITHEQRDDGSIVWYAVHPITKQRVEIDSEQLWFWTAEWQAGERQVDKDLKEGNYEEFDDMNAFIDSL